MVADFEAQADVLLHPVLNTTAEVPAVNSAASESAE
jgi:hypothetical protein